MQTSTAAASKRSRQASGENSLWPAQVGMPVVNRLHGPDQVHGLRDVLDPPLQILGRGDDRDEDIGVHAGTGVGQNGVDLGVNEVGHLLRVVLRFGTADAVPVLVGLEG